MCVIYIYDFLDTTKAMEPQEKKIIAKVESELLHNCFSSPYLISIVEQYTTFVNLNKCEIRTLYKGRRSAVCCTSDS